MYLFFNHFPILLDSILLGGESPYSLYALLVFPVSAYLDPQIIHPRFPCGACRVALRAEGRPLRRRMLPLANEMKKSLKISMCVFITAVPVTKLFAWRGGACVCFTQTHPLSLVTSFNVDPRLPPSLPPLSCHSRRWGCSACLPGCVLVNRGIWRNRLSRLQI